MLSRVRRVKPAALTAGCSIPGSPLSVPLLTMGCSHIGIHWGQRSRARGCRVHAPVCQHSPGSWHGSAALLAPERRDTGTATCSPRAAGWARGTAASHLGLQDTGSGTPAPQCLVTPQNPALQRHAACPVFSTEHRAAAPSAAMPGTYHSDAQLPPWQCHPPLPSAASRVPVVPECQPSPVPALRPSPTHTGCGQAAGRRAGRLQADALCLGLLQG